MKGTKTFADSTWEVSLDGESWIQGQRMRVRGKILEGKTHPHESVWLAFIDKKKWAKDDPKAYQLMQEFQLPANETSFRIDFQLDKHCFITERHRSPYLFYGPYENPKGAGQLEVEIKPLPLYETVIQQLEYFHRFVYRLVKWTKKGVEFKLSAPKATEYSQIELLYLTLSCDLKKNLQFHFDFRVKALDLMGGTTKIVKKSASRELTLAPADYQVSPDQVDIPKIQAALEEVLSSVRGTRHF